MYTKNQNLLRGGKIFLKVTGRLKLVNINQLLPFMRKVYEKNPQGFISAYLNGRKPFSDSRFFFFSSDFFPILLSYKERINKSHWFEHIMNESVSEAKVRGLRFVYPNHRMRVDGTGSMGDIYNLTDGQYRKQDFKHQLKRVLFAVGILPRQK